MMSTSISSEYGEIHAFSHPQARGLIMSRDTVSSVGLFRNKNYVGAESAENICFFRQALALDERRVKFLPEYVAAPRDWFKPGEFGPPRCKEVWFRGCHSDMYVPFMLDIDSTLQMTDGTIG
jgi:Uncharacterized alpha/beta hydrolase domain (DUF2235)